jgi:hypothetical protein
MDGYTVVTPLADAVTAAHYERASAAGIDGINTMTWVVDAGSDASVADKIDGMRRFRKDFALDG